MNTNALALKNKFFIREGRENFRKKEIRLLLYLCVFQKRDGEERENCDKVDWKWKINEMDSDDMIN